MDKLSFYDVDKDYIYYLQQQEIKQRGFTKVPNVEYENDKKFLCGVVLSINNINYYVPVTSYKKQQSENFLIVFDDDKFNKIKGSLRFNYMIPVPEAAITERIINKENNPSRRVFLQKQLEYIISNTELIQNRAKRTYLRIINNYNPQLTKNSCDFKLLEKKCLTFKKEDLQWI